MHRTVISTALLGLLATTAHAVDVSTALENWAIAESGANGNSGDDVATGVAIDSNGRYVLVGALDGATGEGTSAFAYTYSAEGVLDWMRIEETGAADGLYKTAVDDIYWDVEVDSTDQICIAGSLSTRLSPPPVYTTTTTTTTGTTTTTTTGTTTSTGTTTTTGTTTSTGTTTTWTIPEWDTSYHIARLSDVDGVPHWMVDFQDSDDSHTQAAFGVDVNSLDEVWVTGYTYRAAFIGGHWITQGYTPNTAVQIGGYIDYNYGSDWLNPDQALDVAVDSEDNLIVVGVLGFDGGTPGFENRDGYVAKIQGKDVFPATGPCDPCAGDVIWSAQWGAGELLDDAFTGVDVDSNDEVFVSGYTNRGTDNGAGADRNWLMVKYDKDGAAGVANSLWLEEWESDAGADESAWDVHVDGDDNAVFGGSWIDNGQSAWRVAVIDGGDGTQLSERAWASTGGPSRVTAIDVRDGTVAVAGEAHNGTDLDAQLVILDSDDDGDGVGNSVDGCPDDEDKVEPGACGCGVPDDDGDGDGFEDCPGVDDCPDNYYKQEEGVCGCDLADFDTDGDGVLDCDDTCWEDPDKVTPGECGCNNPETDEDNDGVIACDDACRNTPEGVEVDENGCPIGDGDNNDTDDGNDSTAGGGCGCDASPTPPQAAWLGLVLLLGLRRRQD